MCVCVCVCVFVGYPVPSGGYVCWRERQNSHSCHILPELCSSSSESHTMLLGHHSLLSLSLSVSGSILGSWTYTSWPFTHTLVEPRLELYIRYPDYVYLLYVKERPIP